MRKHRKASNPSRSAFLVLTEDRQSASALGTALRSRLSDGGSPVPVLTPPMSSRALAHPDARTWLQSWWDTQQTGVPFSSTVVVALDGEGAQVGPYGDTAEVLVAGVDELADAVAGYGLAANFSPATESEHRFGFLPAALVTGALVAGGWMLSAAFSPDSASAQTMDHTQGHHQLKHSTREHQQIKRVAPSRQQVRHPLVAHTYRHPTVPQIKRAVPTTHAPKKVRLVVPKTHTTVKHTPRLSHTALNTMTPRHSSTPRWTADMQSALRPSWTPQRSFPWTHAMQSALQGSSAQTPTSPTPLSTGTGLPSYSAMQTPSVDTASSSIATPSLSEDTGGVSQPPPTNAHSMTSYYSLPAHAGSGTSAAPSSDLGQPAQDGADQPIRLASYSTPLNATDNVSLAPQDDGESTPSTPDGSSTPALRPLPGWNDPANFAAAANMAPGTVTDSAAGLTFKGLISDKLHIMEGRDQDGTPAIIIGNEAGVKLPTTKEELKDALSEKIGPASDRPVTGLMPNAGMASDAALKFKLWGYGPKIGVMVADDPDRPGQLKGGPYAEWATPTGADRMTLMKDGTGINLKPSSSENLVPDIKSAFDGSWNLSNRIKIRADGKVEGLPDFLNDNPTARDSLLDTAVGGVGGTYSLINGADSAIHDITNNSISDLFDGNVAKALNGDPMDIPKALKDLGNGVAGFFILPSDGVGAGLSVLGFDRTGHVIADLGEGVGAGQASAWNGLGDAATALGDGRYSDALSAAMNGYGDDLGHIGNGVANAWNDSGAGPAVNEFGDWVGTNMSRLTDPVFIDSLLNGPLNPDGTPKNGLIDAAKSADRAAQNGTGSDWYNAASDVSNGFGNAESDLGEGFDAAGSSLSDGFSDAGTDLSNGVSDASSAFGNGIADAGSSLSTGFGDATSSLGTGFGSAATDMSGGLSDAGSSLSTGFGSAATDMSTGLSDAGSSFGSGDLSGAASSFGSGVSNAATDIGTGISDATSSVGTGITNAATDVGTGISDAASSVGTGISDAASSVGTGISDAASSVGSGIGDAASSIGSGISDAASSVGTGISDAASSVASGVGDAASSVFGGGDSGGGDTGGGFF